MDKTEIPPVQQSINDKLKQWKTNHTESAKPTSRSSKAIQSRALSSSSVSSSRSSKDVTTKSSTTKPGVTSRNVAENISTLPQQISRPVLSSAVSTIVPNKALKQAATNRTSSAPGNILSKNILSKSEIIPKSNKDSSDRPRRAAEALLSQSEDRLNSIKLEINTEFSKPKPNIQNLTTNEIITRNTEIKESRFEVSPSNSDSNRGRPTDSNKLSPNLSPNSNSNSNLNSNSNSRNLSPNSRNKSSSSRSPNSRKSQSPLKEGSTGTIEGNFKYTIIVGLLKRFFE